MRRRGILAGLAVLATGVAAALLWLTAARPLDASTLPAHTADLRNGELIYHASGCISCHKGESGDLPTGGVAFATPIGTFWPPNLTPDPETGLGKWSAADFLNAVQHGVSPSGEHYIPAFPYVSYHRMKPTDVLDLHAYLQSLAPVAAPSRPTDIPFEWAVRRATGIWKRLAMEPAPAEDPTRSALWNRGQYLVTGPGHCGECHTPRNILMLPDNSSAFGGGPHPEGKVRVPSLLSLAERGRYASANDLADALSLGEMGGYDRLSSGGMGSVQENISKLPEEDIRAIAEYLVSLK